MSDIIPDSNYKQVTFWEDEDGRGVYEFYLGALYAHCYIYNEKLSTYKKLKEVWGAFKQWASLEGIEDVYSYTQNLKFCQFLDPCEVIGVVTIEDKTYEVVEWELK